MQHEAARPKGQRSLDDAPMLQPMRQGQEMRRNPSASDKKVRRANMRKSADYVPGHVQCERCGNSAHPVLGDGTGPSCSVCGSYDVHSTRPASADREWSPMQVQHRTPEYELTAAKTATVLDTQAWKLNPGDSIRTPNGRTMKVMRVRPHETSMNHVYVDTDGGTTLVDRNAGFQVVPHNAQQQSMPGYGTPGGNSNHLPWDNQSGGNNSPTPSTQCPTCGTKNSMVRQGDHFTCSRCGFKEQFGGAGGYAFSDNPRVVKTFSTINTTGMSAIARRAQQVLDQEETK